MYCIRVRTSNRKISLTNLSWRGFDEGFEAEEALCLYDCNGFHFQEISDK